MSTKTSFLKAGGIRGHARDMHDSFDIVTVDVKIGACNRLGDVVQ